MLHSVVRYSIIIVAASLLFFPFLGQVHLFDWDEINFAECAREMIVTDNYLRVQIDYQPFWEKPPLFIWMQVLSMKLFGVGEYAARFPNALIGVVTLVTLFYVGKKVVAEKMGWWWAILYAATWLPHFYFKSGIIDPVFNYFIFLSFFQMHLLRFADKKVMHAVLAGVFLGLAVLTKGPAAILIALLAFIVYIIVNKGIWGYKPLQILYVFLAAFGTVSIWFGAEIIMHGWWFVNEFITYQIRLFQTEDAGHGGPFFYHFIILLIGCFPAAAFLFQFSRKRVSDTESQRDFTRWMWILFWVVLILFSIVKTKIVHYSSLCYFPLTFLAALQVYKLAEEQIKLKGLVKVILTITGCIWGIVLIAMPLIGLNKEKLIPYIKDPFAVGNLQANVPWSMAEVLIGVFYLIAICVAIWMMRKSFQKGITVLCAAQILAIQIVILHFTPKIEAYSQRAAIEYFESFQGEDVYVQVLGYKSYAHLFYTRKMPPDDTAYYNREWLLTGEVTKPVYFISKNIEADKYRAMPTLEEIGSKNGFVFFRRKK